MQEVAREAQFNLRESEERSFNYEDGYFGKRTKPRTSEPSMFEILTWNTAVDKSSVEEKKSNVRQCNARSKSPGSPGKNKVEAKNNQAREPHNTSKKNQQISREGRSNDHVIENRKYNEQAQNEQYHRAQAYTQNLRPKSAQQKGKKALAYNHQPYSPKFVKETKKQDVQQQPQQKKQKLIEQFKQTTRWIPNSSFTTYFGKPAFENYGRGNTSPTYGGIMYGNYLKTHNVQPHRGLNSPKSMQSYNVALMKGQEIGPIYPFPPKVPQRESHAILEKSKEAQMKSSQIYQEENNERSLPIYPPNLYDLQKFGGKGIQKVGKSRLVHSQLEKENDEKQQSSVSRPNMKSPPRPLY